MTEKEAIAFLRKHVEWERVNWGYYPEGKLYYKKFIKAIDTLDKQKDHKNG